MDVAEREVAIPVGEEAAAGDLTLPGEARSIVVFAHGSGSSRHSPRNRQVAADLQQRGLATLLMDLLTPSEERVDVRTRELRFDIGLLAERLVAAREWLGGDESTSGLGIGYFGASTGAAAALTAAAGDDTLRAVVSRGGRPDLSIGLAEVQAPTLLIVGGNDHVVIDMNRQAAAQLRCPHEIEIVPGASHLFEEPGALEEVSRLAGDWFTSHLTSA